MTDESLIDSFQKNFAAFFIKTIAEVFCDCKVQSVKSQLKTLQVGYLF